MGFDTKLGLVLLSQNNEWQIHCFHCEPNSSLHLIKIYQLNILLLPETLGTKWHNIVVVVVTEKWHQDRFM